MAETIEYRYERKVRHNTTNEEAAFTIITLRDKTTLEHIKTTYHHGKFGEMTEEQFSEPWYADNWHIVWD